MGQPVTGDLNEKDVNGKLVHEAIINEHNAKEIDLLMFNEIMNMLTGDLAMTRYHKM